MGVRAGVGAAVGAGWGTGTVGMGMEMGTGTRRGIGKKYGNELLLYIDKIAVAKKLIIGFLCLIFIFHLYFLTCS